MTTESVFRAAFWVLMGLTLLMRFYFISKVRMSGGHIMPDQSAVRREGTFVFVFRLSGFFLLVGLLALYALQPTVIETLSISSPDWLRWTGFAMGLVSLACWGWVQLALGKQFSAQLRLQEGHRLITTGPYATVRHPMYAAISGFALGLALLTTNWLFVILVALVIVGLILRVPREEQMMIDAFGDEYQTYMTKTGRYIPKWLAG